MANTISAFTPGDLVVSVSGDGDGSGTYGDNQASPITLDELAVNGSTAPATVVGQLVLPQTASVNASGVNENAISGEYGSSSEGSLELSADGQSLTIAGYGVNAKTFNSDEAGYSSTMPGPYGTNALAQTTSIPGGTYTAVPRVIADIGYNGTVDTSTAVYDVDNTNNPRSVVTTNGSSFYLSGQGVKGDTTQGVFYVKDGASSGTAIDTSTDTRTIELYDGNLYVSRDSKQGPTANIDEYSGEPTSKTPPSVLPGISQNVALSPGQGNAINGSTGTVNLSPENFFFANPTTLYVADSGLPKQGGVGDGGLQKWSLTNGTWKLDYTLSSGLGLVNGTTASSGTTGLIGLTGQVSGNSVQLYATNATIGDTDPTYLYGINDQLSATNAPSGESFSTLMTAAPDTNIRGVAFAPQAATVCFASGTRIRTARGDVAVEHLAVGDVAVTASGAHRPIRWLGHRLVDCRRHPAPHEAMPVRIAAHAFGPDRPSRDLLVSPGHAICVDVAGEVLIPAGVLVNGGTVVRAEVDTVTYWHVELDSHDILLAENLPAESYLDMGNRRFFASSSVVGLAATPDAPVEDRSGFCRPFHDAGPVVEAVRAYLLRVAARAAAVRSAA